MIHFVRWFLGVGLFLVGLGLINHGWTLREGARSGSAASIAIHRAHWWRAYLWMLAGVITGTIADLVLP